MSIILYCKQIKETETAIVISIYNYCIPFLFSSVSQSACRPLKVLSREEGAVAKSESRSSLSGVFISSDRSSRSLFICTDDAAGDSFDGSAGSVFAVDRVVSIRVRNDCDFFEEIVFHRRLS